MPSQNPEPKQSPEPKTPNDSDPDPEAAPNGEFEKKDHEAEDEDEEEEEEECGFCLFMKGGGCKAAFVEWENCIEQADINKEDIAEKCFEATSALKKCMEAHADYYAPILQAEKRAEEKALKELEEEEKKKDKDSQDLENKRDG